MHQQQLLSCTAVMETIQKHKHIAFSSSNAVRNFCDSLFQASEISGFYYSRVYLDGSRIALTTHPKLLEINHINEKRRKSDYTPDIIPKNIHYMLFNLFIESIDDINTRNLFIDLLRAERESCQLAFPFTLVKRNTTYTEYTVYFSNPNNQQIINYYYNNLHILKNFKNLFCQDFNKLIKESEKQKIILPWRDTNPRKSQTPGDVSKHDLINSKLAAIQMQLSSQEIRCLYYLLAGYPNKKIARLLAISPRTVEKYIDSLKIKFNCHRKYDIINLALKHDLMNINFDI